MGMNGSSRDAVLQLCRRRVAGLLGGSGMACCSSCTELARLPTARRLTETATHLCHCACCACHLCCVFGKETAVVAKKHRTEALKEFGKGVAELQARSLPCWLLG